MSHLVVLGVANDRSLAWQGLLQCHSAYKQIHLGVLDERTQSKVLQLVKAKGWEHKTRVVICDLQKDKDLDNLFENIPDEELTGLIHAVAFTDRACLSQPFSEVTREQFQLTLDISCFSFIQVMQKAKKKFQPGASSLCLSYLGSERAVPHYNVMGVAKAALESATRYLSAEFGAQGVRVNTVSAGPVRTLAASAIKDFKKMLSFNEISAPLGRNITGEEVGKAMAFLLSSQASALTGTTFYVDGGAHVAFGPRE